MDVLNAILIIGFLLIGIALFSRQIQRGLAPAEQFLSRPGKSSLLDFLEDPRIFRSSVVLLFAIAIFIRLFQFGSIPIGMNQDGAMGAVDAKALLDYGTDRFGMFLPVHFTAWEYGQMSVLLSYLTVPFIGLFGFNEVTVRLPMLLVSLLGMLVCYLYAKEIFPKKLVVMILFLLAINPWHIMQSRWALDCNLFPHFILFGLYFLYKGLHKQWYLYVSMIFFGLSMYTYGISFYSIPLLLLILCIYLLVKKQIKARQVLLCGAVYFLVSWPMYAMMIINYFKLTTWNTPFFTIPYFEQSIRVNDLIFFNPVKDWGTQISTNFNYVLNLLLQKDDLPWNTTAGFGTAYIISIPFLLFGVFGLSRVRKKSIDPHKKTGMLFIGVWFLVAIVTALMKNGANVNNANILFYPLILLTAVGLYLFLDRIRLKSVAVVTIASFFLMFCLFSGTYFNKSRTVRFFEGFGESIRYAEQTNRDELYITQSTLGSQILTMFYTEMDAEYFQGKGGALKENGEKMLDYEQRYHFVNYRHGNVPLHKENAVYIFSVNEKLFFDRAEGEYEFTMFGEYGVAVLKS